MLIAAAVPEKLSEAELESIRTEVLEIVVEVEYIAGIG